MRVYISGPITNDKDYKEKFAKAEAELKAQGYDVINPTVLDPLKLDYEEFMGIDFQLIDMCDAMVMLDGWQQSRGANREYRYALAKDLIILEIEKLLKKEKVTSNGWIPVSERYPDNDNYVLMSFSNFSLPAIGRYEEDEEGGAFYIRNDKESCISQNIIVNAWMKLPDCYEE